VAEPSLLFSRLAVVSLLSAVVMFAVYALVAGLVLRRGLAAVTVGALAAGYTNANNIGLPIALHMLGNPALVAPIVLYQTGVFAPIGLAILAAKEGSGRRRPATEGEAGRAETASAAAEGKGAGSEDAGGGGRADGPRKRPVWRTVGGALANPIVVGSLGGLAVSVSGLEIPGVLLDPLDLIGGAAIPVMLIGFGMSLHGRPLLAKGGARADVVLASAMKLLLMPLTAWLLGRFAFGLDAAGLFAVTVLAALPTAQNVFNYALRYDASPILARDAVTITTLGAAPLVFLLAALFA
jgi:predicted permease